MKTFKFLILSLIFLFVTVGASNNAPLAIPSKPGAVSPVNGGLTTNYTPQLKWTNTGATYDIQVATDPSFGVYIIDFNYGFSGNTHTVGVALDPAKTYFWRVQAYDIYSVASGWSATFSFRTAVLPPTLTDPADSSVLVNNRPTFKWSSVLNATGYTLQVSRYTTFSILVLNVSVSYTATQYTPTVDLPANTTLYWRVRTLSSTYGPSAWSPGPVGKYFTISQTAIPPTTPVLVYPGDNKLTDDHTPRLLWNPVTLPSSLSFDHYQVQVSKDKTFAGMDPLTIVCSPPACIDDQPATTDRLYYWYDVPDPASELDPATTYYWRVRTFDNDGINPPYASNWSTIFTLRTTVPQVTPLAPADTSNLLDNRPAFDWTPVTAANSYNIQVSASSTFSTLLLNVNTTVRPYKPSTALPPAKKLYWRIRGMNPTYGPGRWSDPVWSFNTANPPSTPTLGSPVGGILLTRYTPTFNWTVSYVPIYTTFAYYQIQVAKNGLFSAPDIDDTSVTNQYIHTFVPGSALDPLSKYYWRVRACNTDSECSSYSPAAYFRTAVAPPTLVTYGGGSLSLPFDWNDVTGATSYNIQISRYANFSTLVINATVGASQYTPSISLPNGTYYWRVRSNNTYFGPSAWQTPPPPDSFTIP
jgi:hypothetical protein